MQKQFISNIVDEPKIFKLIKLKPANRWQALLQRFKIKDPEYLPIKIQAASYRTSKKIALLILEIKNKSELEGNDQIYDLVYSNSDVMAMIIATAVHNSPTPVPDILIDSLFDNFTNQEMKEIIEEVDRRLDIASFFGGISYLKKIQIQIGIQETTAKQPLSEIPNSPTS